MQKLELEKLNLLKLWKEGFLGIDLFSYQSWDTLPEEEEHALGVYGKKEPIFKMFRPRQTIALNPNRLIFEHLPTDRKIYPLVLSIQKSREVASTDMPFSTSLDL